MQRRCALCELALLALGTLCCQACLSTSNELRQPPFMMFFCPVWAIVCVYKDEP